MEGFFFIFEILVPNAVDGASRIVLLNLIFVS